MLILNDFLCDILTVPFEFEDIQPYPPQYTQPGYNQQPGFTYPAGQMNYPSQPYPNQGYPGQGYPPQPGYQPYPQHQIVFFRLVLSNLDEIPEMVANVVSLHFLPVAQVVVWRIVVIKVEASDKRGFDFISFIHGHLPLEPTYTYLLTAFR
uniref:Rhodopsin n=1 Tax=Angiostrongylus cantonensis TaxID=6313 RepID=A0A158PAT0_ANGCA